MSIIVSYCYRFKRGLRWRNLHMTLTQSCISNRSSAPRGKLLFWVLCPPSADRFASPMYRIAQFTWSPLLCPEAWCSQRVEKRSAAKVISRFSAASVYIQSSFLFSYHGQLWGEHTQKSRDDGRALSLFANRCVLLAAHEEFSGVTCVSADLCLNLTVFVGWCKPLFRFRKIALLVAMLW